MGVDSLNDMIAAEFLGSGVLLTNTEASDLAHIALETIRQHISSPDELTHAGPKPIGKYSGPHPSMPDRHIVGYIYDTIIKEGQIRTSFPMLREIVDDPRQRVGKGG